MQSPERPPLLKTASRRSLLRRAHLRRALFAALLLYLGLWAPAALRLQAAALPSLLQTLETAIFDAPCADCYSISLDSPCSTEISESKWCQRFWWARRALPASPLLGRPAAADALILDLNCRHQYRYDYYHMLFDCSIPIMPMLGLVRRQEALGAPSALVGVHERGFQNVTAAVLQSFSPYPFVHVDGRVAEEGVVYGGDAALRAADMAPAYQAGYVHRKRELYEKCTPCYRHNAYQAGYVHRKRELYEKCTPCYRHNAYQAYGIEDPPPGAAGSILILWRDPALRGRNAGGRAIVDHGWLVEGLRERFGAARLAVHYGNESAEATVRLFAGAQVVVGYHGAGMVNAVFCRQGTLVVEVTTFADAAASHSLQIWRANMPAVYHGLGLDFSLHLVEHHHLRPGLPANVTDWDHVLKPSNVYLSREHIYLIVEKVERWLARA